MAKREMFMTVDEAATALGFVAQTVRNRITDGSMRAIQTTTGGAYRIPRMEVEAFKRRHGMAPRNRIKVPDGVVYADAELIYQEELAPVIADLGAKSPEEALRMLRERSTSSSDHTDFLAAYSAWASALGSNSAG
jgi:excisionase family DNA binding protein